VAAIFLYLCGLTVFQFNHNGSFYFPLREPDLAYHFTRVLTFLSGPRERLVFDPTMNFPCGLHVPWPWGFDGILAGFAWVARALGGGQERADLARSVSFVIPMATTAMLGLLHVTLKRMGSYKTISLLVVGLLALTPAVRTVGYYGSIDNKLADFVVHFAFTAVVIRAGRSGRISPWASVAVFGLLSASDLAILNAGLLCIVELITRVHAQRRESMGWFFALTLTTLVFLIGERLTGLARSYQGVFWAYVAGMGLLLLLGAMFSLGRFTSFKRFLSALAAGCVLVAALAALTLPGNLLQYFSKTDGVVEGINEAQAPWLYYGWVFFFTWIALAALAVRAVWRTNLTSNARYFFIGQTALATILFTMQVKFDYLIVLPAAIGVALTITQGIRWCRVWYRGPTQGTWLATPVFASGFVAWVLFVTGPYLLGAPLPETRAWYAMATVLAATNPGHPCVVGTPANAGTLVNHLTGCHVASSTFWGDKCSLDGHRLSESAQTADLRSVHAIAERGIRYMIIQTNADHAVAPFLKERVIHRESFVAFGTTTVNELQLVDLGPRSR